MTQRWKWETIWPCRREFARTARSLGHGPVKAVARKDGECEIVELVCGTCGGEMHFGPGYSSACGRIDLRHDPCTGLP